MSKTVVSRGRFGSFFLLDCRKSLAAVVDTLNLLLCGSSCKGWVTLSSWRFRCTILESSPPITSQDVFGTDSVKRFEHSLSLHNNGIIDRMKVQQTRRKVVWG
jgi:hypothetical protein